jgi:hypothetical protein
MVAQPWDYDWSLDVALIGKDRSEKKQSQEEEPAEVRECPDAARDAALILSVC